MSDVFKSAERNGRHQVRFHSCGRHFCFTDFCLSKSSLDVLDFSCIQFREIKTHEFTQESYPRVSFGFSWQGRRLPILFLWTLCRGCVALGDFLTLFMFSSSLPSPLSNSYFLSVPNVICFIYDNSEMSRKFNVFWIANHLPSSNNKSLFGWDVFMGKNYVVDEVTALRRLSFIGQYHTNSQLAFFVRLKILLCLNCRSV